MHRCVTRSSSSMFSILTVRGSSAIFGTPVRGIEPRLLPVRVPVCVSWMDVIRSGSAHLARNDIKGFYVQGNCVHGLCAYRGPHTPDLNRTNCKNMGVSFHRPVNQQPVVKFDKPVLTEFDSEPSQFLLVCSLNLSDDSFPVLRRPTLVLQGILQRFLTDRMVCFMVHVIPPRHTDARATGTWFSGFFR